MKYHALAVIIIICIVFPVFSTDYTIYTSPGGELLDVNSLAVELIKYDVIFFGEMHGEEVLHRLELDLLSTIHRLYPGITVSMEMFERDVQDILNSYLRGEIDETEFLERSRPWSNYLTDYKPLVEFAVENQLELIASNVPRRYAALIRTGGWAAVRELPPDERIFTADSLVVPDDEYKIKFMEAMSYHPGADNSAMGGMDMESFYIAQCLKDDTMAESIYRHLAGTDGKVIHFNGHFHSDHHLGTVRKLRSLNKELKIAVISPYRLETGDRDRIPEPVWERGDFIVVMREK